MSNSEISLSGSAKRKTRIASEQQRLQNRQARYERAFRRSGTGFRIWWLKLLGRMTTVVKTITNTSPTRRRRSLASAGGLRTQFSAAYESLEPKLLLTADITGIDLGTYNDSLGVDTATTNTLRPTLSGTKDINETVTLTYKDSSGTQRTQSTNAVGENWSIKLDYDIAGFVPGAVHLNNTYVTANINQDEVKLILDDNPPDVAITSDVIGIANGDVTFTFTFDEPVTDFESGDITPTGGVAGTFTAVSTKVYTLEVTPNPGATEITVDVATEAATDAAGNKSAANSATVAVDTVAPALEITDDRDGVTNGPVTFKFTFTEPVTGFFPNDIQIIGGSKGDFRRTDVDGAEYTLYVVPFVNSDAPITVTVNADVAFDAAKNGNDGPVNATQDVDTIRPSVTITDPTAGTKANISNILVTPVLFEIEFKEAVEGFTESDVIVSGGLIDQFLGGGSGYTVTVIPDSNSLSPITVSIAAGVAEDVNGNTNTAAAQLTKAVDTVAPTVTITDNKFGTANGPVTFTFKFSEDVGDSFTVGDVQLSPNVLAVPGTFTKLNDTVYTLVVIPNADQMGTLTVTVPVGAAVDLAGNDNVEKSVTQAFDTMAPFLESVLSNKDPMVATNGPVTFTFKFSEPVLGFSSGDVIVTGGTKSTFSGSGKVYSLVVNPTLNSTADITINVPANAAVDAGGTGNKAQTDTIFEPVVQKVDTKKPTVVITDNVPGTANSNAPVTFTFQFSEKVTGFDASDVTVTGGTKGASVVQDPSDLTKYTLVVTPNANSLTPITVRIAENRLKDLAGNNNDATVTVTQTVDTVVPTLVITDNKPGIANGPVTFTFTFSENVFGFTSDLADMTVTGGTPGALTGGGRSYSMIVTPPINSVTPIIVKVLADAATDLAGNKTTAASVTQEVDTVAPTVLITDSVDSIVTPKTNGQDTFTFTFSEPVTGFTSSDIVVTGGTKGTFAGSGALYTLVVTPFAESTTDITVAVAAGVANDLAGNLNKAALTNTQGVDTKKPTVSISDNKAGTTNGPVVYTFVFSETVSGFEVGDVVVTGGTKGTLQPPVLPNIGYTLIVTPNENSTTPINVSVPAGVATDPVGNLNTSAVAAAQLVDTVRPVLTITDNKPGITNGPVTFTFKFSENVTGFTTDDVKINGDPLPAGFTKSALTGSGQLYSMTITPPAGSTDSFEVSVADNMASDAATNGNVGASVSQEVDRKAPTPTITSTAGDQLEKVTVATGPVTFRFEFDETVTGFTSDDIVITNGTRSSFSAFPNSDGKIYELLVFPNANTDGILKVSVAANAAFDNAQNGSVAASFQHTLSTKIPSVVITDNKTGTVTAATGDITYTFTFSEEVVDFDENDIAVTNGTKVAFEVVSAKVYRLVVAPATGIGQLTVEIAAGSFEDLDGNLNAVLTRRVKSLFNP